MTTQSVPRPEIMSPAGYWPQLHAAIEAGADSVYFGLRHFSARAKVGFSESELPEVMRVLHSRGVKGFVAFNTLVFDHELREAARALAAIAEAGADAIIIQDLGILGLVRQIAPDLEVHGSTQMSITDAAGVRLAHELGVSRVTLARELSLSEIRKIREVSECELEIFVHGALCVAYSGQCFSSEAWGGRSANRGQCAQACRLPYELVVDDVVRPLGDARYLLSPGDLYALHHVPEIVSIGISSLKIEGRYKDASYVALTTAAYRRAVDDAYAGLPVSVSALDEIRLEQVYSRGLGPWFLSGTNHQEVVKGRAPRHRGVLAGRVTQLTSRSVVIEPDPGIGVSPLKPGDGVVFDAADWRSPGEPEEGGRIYSVAPGPDGSLELSFANNALDFTRIRKGDLLWRTDDPDVEKAVKPWVTATVPLRKQSLDVHAVAREGEHLQATWTLSANPSLSVVVQSEQPLGPARRSGITEGQLIDGFGRLGNTAYELGEVSLVVDGSPFVPASMLNGMRRQAVETIEHLQTRAVSHEVREPEETLTNALAAAKAHRVATVGEPSIHLLVRTPEQLEAALQMRPASITLDYLDLYGLRPSVDKVKQAGLEVRVATPRILKPGEERVLEFLKRLDCPLLVRSSGILRSLRDSDHAPLTGDFSLNVANALTGDELLNLGLERITPGFDLNSRQITELTSVLPPGKIESIAYSHLPVFHTEHCVFCRFLSTGTSYKDCGRPCEKHRLELRDTAGRSHPVMADTGCRNTVFGAEAQEASGSIRAWLDAGIRHFRLEFAHESGNDVISITTAFQLFFQGRRTTEQLRGELRRISPQGTTEGSLFVPAGFNPLQVLS